MTASCDDNAGAIEVACCPDGTLLYAVPGSATALPPVRPRDLLACWDAARRMAAHGAWGIPRRFRFGDHDAPIELALIDADAGCWAEAVDARVSLHTRQGMSLCLRLLALIDLLAHSAIARRMMAVQDGEAELHPALVATAARCPLRPDARFAEADLLAGLGGACELLPHQPGSRP